jgi:hypothetical protein
MGSQEEERSLLEDGLLQVSFLSLSLIVLSISDRLFILDAEYVSFVDYSLAILGLFL